APHHAVSPAAVLRCGQGSHHPAPVHGPGYTGRCPSRRLPGSPAGRLGAAAEIAALRLLAGSCGSRFGWGPGLSLPEPISGASPVLSRAVHRSRHHGCGGYRPHADSALTPRHPGVALRSPGGTGPHFLWGLSVSHSRDRLASAERPWVEKPRLLLA